MLAGVPRGRRLTRGVGLRDRSGVRGAARSGCATFIDTRADPARTDPPTSSRRTSGRRSSAHLQEQVKARGLWGAFLDPKLGGAGLRAAEARADVGDHRPLHDVDDDLRRAGARQRQHGAARPRRDRRAEGTLALAQPARRDLERVRAHRAVPRRRRPDRDRHHRDAGRRRVGDRRPQVVHHQRVGRRHRARLRRDQPRGPPAPARVDVRRAGRHAGHGDRARHRHDGASRRVEYGRLGNHAEIVFRELPRAGRPPDRRSPATGSCSRSSASAAAASTTRCAGSARRSGRSTSCASGRCRGPRTASCWRSTRWCRTTSRCRTWRSRRPASSRSRPRGRWTSTAPPRCGPTSA